MPTGFNQPPIIRKGDSGNQKSRNNQKQTKIDNKQQGNPWLQGTATANDGNKKHQLKFICLGVRSGSDETPASLKAELDQK